VKWLSTVPSEILEEFIVTRDLAVRIPDVTCYVNGVHHCCSSFWLH